MELGSMTGQKSGEVRSSFIFSHWKASGKMIWILFYEKIQSISFRLCILPSIELDERKKHKKNIHFMIMWTLWFLIFYFVVSQNQPFFIKWGVQSIHSVLNLSWKIKYDKIRHSVLEHKKDKHAQSLFGSVNAVK